MRKYFMALLFAGTVTAAPVGHANAQAALVAQVIREGVKKAITAVDLKIQRLQNKTLVLENAQKVLENGMSRLKLQQIAGWVQKQKDLYQEYYQELWKVKEAVTLYEQVKDITREQEQLLREYKQAWKVFRQDGDFSAAELGYMAQVPFPRPLQGEQGVLPVEAQKILVVPVHGLAGFPDHRQKATE